jgi:hypothetical protein
MEMVFDYGVVRFLDVLICVLFFFLFIFHRTWILLENKMELCCQG